MRARGAAGSAPRPRLAAPSVPRSNSNRRAPLPPPAGLRLALVKRPLPPMSDSGWFRILSPVVLMMMISSAPSSCSSGNAFCAH